MQKEKSLAQFIQEKREQLGMSAIGLAKKSYVQIDVIEKIEAGQELFLPTTIRQNLAKALKCSINEIKELEINFDINYADKNSIDNIKNKILSGEKNLLCPKCNSPLITRIAKMYDLEDNLMLHPKARCSKCVFQIKD